MTTCLSLYLRWAKTRPPTSCLSLYWLREHHPLRHPPATCEYRVCPSICSASAKSPPTVLKGLGDFRHNPKTEYRVCPSICPHAPTPANNAQRFSGTSDTPRQYPSARFNAPPGADLTPITNLTKPSATQPEKQSPTAESVHSAFRPSTTPTSNPGISPLDQPKTPKSSFR